MAKVDNVTLKQAFSTGSKPTGNDFENLIDTLEVSETEKQAWNKKSDFNGDYNSLTNKPTIPAVPTKTSQLTNDSGFETVTASQTKATKSLTDAKAYTDGEITELMATIPTKVSQLTNDGNFDTVTGSQAKATKSLTDAKTFTSAEVAKLVTRIDALEARIVALETPSA